MIKDLKDSNYYWKEGKVLLNMFDEEINVCIEEDELDYTIKCIKHLNSLDKKIIDKLLNCSIDYCINFMEEVGEDLDTWFSYHDDELKDKSFYDSLEKLMKRHDINDNKIDIILNDIRKEIEKMAIESVKEGLEIFIKSIKNIMGSKAPIYLVRPKFNKPNDIKKYIKPLNILIEKEESENERLCIMVEFDCMWEEEHGLFWLIRDNDILYVGDSSFPPMDKELSYYENLEYNFAYGNRFF